MPHTRTLLVRRSWNAALAAVTLAALVLAIPRAAEAAPTRSASAQSGPTDVAREVEPVVLTGADVPAWSGPAATGIADPTPPPAVTVRDAHNGTLTDPPDIGVPVVDIAAYRWNGAGFEEIPVQVDEMFPYFLANANSDFSFYSGTDEELTYAWDTEAWNMTGGECLKEHPEGQGTMQDPVETLDDDDEIVFMAGDAGPRAPEGAPGPMESGSTRQEVAITDPVSGDASFVYLFTRTGGSSFDQTNGYVDYRRDADADEYIDRYSLTRADPEALGVSNTGYGPNLSGTVCRTSSEGYVDPETDQTVFVADGVPRPSTDRFPRDGVTVTTDAYRWRATGRWMVRGMQVAKPEQPGVYGPDLIDRWKGRAFQQSPDSSISVVGFEDEQVNWEANSALLGELAGPVRAIREVWGADSGTNVTKVETFYRDAVTYRYRVRVHPIPPDGLYTSWDYNRDVAVSYYNLQNPDGVAIDGQDDEVFGNIDENPVNGDPMFFDAPDPTHSGASAILSWEQIAGAGDSGSLVYIWELSGATSVTNAVAVPYYRDDKCFDDGTGDDPVPRPWPGEASTDERVQQGYAAQAGKPVEELTCDDKQGAYASHGLHAFVTHDSDNAFGPKPVDEIDIRQWQFAVPTEEPTNVGAAYGNTVVAPLHISTVAITGPSEPNTPPEAEDVEGETTPSTPTPLTLAATDRHTCEMTFEIVEAPSNGTVEGPSETECADGSPNRDSASVTYTPADDFGGTDSFSYRVGDGQDVSEEATATVAVKDLVAAQPVPGGTTGPPPSLQPGVVKKLCAFKAAGDAGHIVGTSGRDILIGTAGKDVMCGLAGRDLMRGGAGKDILIGGRGRDRLFGGRGRDMCRGEKLRSCERRRRA